MPTRRSDTMRAVDAVMPLVDEFNLLDEGDKLTFLDLVDPLPEKHDHRPKKKASKKSSKSQQSSSKSPRASGMAAQLNKSLKQQREAATKDITGESDERCGFKFINDGLPCGQSGDANIHHLKGELGYHPFQPSTTAPPAPAPSSANGESSATERSTRKSAPPSTPETYDERGQTASLSTVGSGTQPEDVGTVAHGARGRD